jgi:NHLM bacteriocin system ABC transporter ATP-binding protein
MSLFGEQLNTRKLNDETVISDALEQISGSVTGKRISATVADERLRSLDAINQVLGYFGKRPCELPEKITKLEEQIEYAVRPYGIMYRTVKLDKGWYKSAVGVMIATKKEGGVAALIPGKIGGYFFFDSDGKKKKLNGKTEKLFESDAVTFYNPLPRKKLTVVSLMKYAFGTLSPIDNLMVTGMTLLISLIGLISPKLNQLLFSTVLESKSVTLLVSIAIFTVCISVSTTLFGAVKSLLNTRVSTKMSTAVQSATMMRILSLPTGFFKDYSAGELTSRATYIGSLCQMIATTIFTTGLTSLFSLIYITQIFAYAPTLVVPALLIILATVLLSIITTFAQMGVSKRQMEIGTKNSGLSYSLVAGVQKIKLSGAEKRAFAKWGGVYAKSAQLSYNPPAIIKLSSVFSLLISSVGTIVMYYFAVRSNIAIADYYAFSTAYGMVSGAFISLVSIASTIAQIKPVLDMAKPIMETAPEVAEVLKPVERVSGNIEINNVSFRYRESQPSIFDNLTLKIKAGQYVAIVGKTGCGKSTLIRLLLGFEKPQKGAVYYDGKDISGLDLQSLRKKLGVVTQDGKLFRGDIYSNIVISAPELSMDDAWAAAEISGIADDIRAMPMGMQTMISEGAGGVSGGQKQRIMIARAIAPKPKVLIFDEATSALDNITQKKVSDALASLKCTRIVVAHRLSTIKQCDRIIVLDGGKIIEDGTYDELIAESGFFAELVERQRINAAD